MASVTPPGTCTWTFDGTNWTLDSSNCTSGYNCAMDNTGVHAAAPVAVTPHRVVSNAEFP